MEQRCKAKLWWTAAWPFLLLCLLNGSRWLFEGMAPGTASTNRSQAAGCFIAAVALALPIVLWRPAATPQYRWTRLAGGTLALCGPALAATFSDRHVNSNDATLALSLTAVLVAVALAAGPVQRSDLTARLWPGLAGLAGLLLLLPQPLFTGWRFAVALASMPLLAGAGAALTQGNASEATVKRGPDRSIIALPWTMLSLLLAGGVFLALSLHPHLHPGMPFSLWAAGLDGLAALLSIVSLQRLGATGWSAQFLAAPLITLLEGAVLLRPVLDLRSWIAFGLLAVSAGYLLFTTPALEGQPTRRGFLRA